MSATSSKNNTAVTMPTYYEAHFQLKERPKWTKFLDDCKFKYFVHNQSLVMNCSRIVFEAFCSDLNEMYCKFHHCGITVHFLKLYDYHGKGYNASASNQC